MREHDGGTALHVHCNESDSESGGNCGLRLVTHRFPLYTYREDGRRREENIPLFTLQHFQKHFRDRAITREDIFHYVYALLHHPEYRTRYAENLKRELRDSVIGHGG